MRPVLSIRLLGGFQLVQGQSPVATITSPGLQSLLAYLVLHAGIPQSRSQLAFLFWPDSSEAQARSHLRTSLHRLRRGLLDADRFLRVDSRTVEWCADAPFALDVAEFQSALARAQLMTAREELEKAIALYRGDLVPGCYDDWILPERERLRQAFLKALEQLVRILESEGDYNAALNHAQHLLQLDPLQETTYHLLMRLHAEHGDRASVVRTFHTCENVLRQELEVEPSTETRLLYEQLRLGSPPAAVERLHALADSNLPVPLTSFVGRARETEEVERLLRTGRLLTLTGPGGSGKSRLALHVARDLASNYQEGVCWIKLAPLADPVLIPQAVASALGIAEQPGRTLTDTLVTALKSRQLLLILDNCEHLVQGCSTFASALLSAGPGPQILATSREPLSIAGERLYLVPPLPLPGLKTEPNWQKLGEVDAVRLFVERAQSVLPTFALSSQNAASVAHVCRELDGLPLAIELAAARIRVMPPDQIAARLDDRFDLLTAGDRTTLPRHRTLRALLDWSYDLLEQNERAFLRRLSVFSGGFTWEAAEALFEPLNVLELLPRLVDKSLVTVFSEGGGRQVRYGLLVSIRRYAWEKLTQTGEADLTRQRHLEFFVQMSEMAERGLAGPDQARWVERLEQELDNVRAALTWSKMDTRRTELGLRLATALWRFWTLRLLGEGREQLNELIARADQHLPRRLYAKSLAAAGDLTNRQGDYAGARALWEESLALRRQLQVPVEIAHSLRGLGNVAYAQGNWATARQLYTESLAVCRGLDDWNGIAWCLSNLGLIAWNEGDSALARQRLEESLAIRRAQGDGGGEAYVLNQLGMVAWLEGDYATLRRLGEQSLSIQRELNDVWNMAYSLDSLGLAAFGVGDWAGARSYFIESMKLFQESGDKWGICSSLERFGALSSVGGNFALAAQLFGAAEALRETMNLPLQPAERRHHERHVHAVQTALGDELFHAEFRGGRNMSLAHAIACALADA